MKLAGCHKISSFFLKASLIGCTNKIHWHTYILTYLTRLGLGLQFLYLSFPWRRYTTFKHHMFEQFYTNLLNNRHSPHVMWVNCGLILYKGVLPIIWIVFVKSLLETINRSSLYNLQYNWVSFFRWQLIFRLEKSLNVQIKSSVPKNQHLNNP